jgi:8-oxo-dGTP pyrophosphatase MutT (NUDIX family)
VPSAEQADHGPTPPGRPPRPGLPPFRPTGEQLVYQGWAIALYSSTFEDPSGAAFQRDVVRHPGAVAVVAVTASDSVILVHQYRPAVDQWVLEVPAGTCDVPGEPTDETARRELAEEAGYAPSELTLLTRCLITPGFCDEVSSVYLATGLRPVPVHRQGIEEVHLSVEEIPLSRFDALVDDGTVVDATTILGVGLARRRLASGR